MCSDFRKVQLSELLESINTGLDAIKRAPIISAETGIKCLRIQDISNSKPFEKWGNTEVSPTDYEKYRLVKDDIIMARTCSTGISLLVQEDLKAVFNNGLARIRLKTERADPQFMSYVFKTQAFVDHIHGISGGTSVQLNMKVGDVARFEFMLPTLAIQRSIAHALGKLDDKINCNRVMNQLLENIAMAIFADWFVDFGPVHSNSKGQNHGLASKFSALFPDAFDGEGLPIGWQHEPITSVIDLNPTERLSKGQQAPYLNMAALSITGCWSVPPILREFTSGTKFRNGDTLLARITPCLENGKTAFMQSLADEEIGWGSTEFIVMRTKDGIPSTFGYLLARHPQFREHAIKSMTGTSGRQRVQSDSLIRYRVAVPPNEIWEAFGEMTEPLFALIKANQEEILTLSMLRDSLLPKLMNGQMRLNQYES